MSIAELRAAMFCKDPLILKQIPDARRKYGIAENAPFYQRAFEQDDHLPRHILEWAHLPCGNMMIWSHHQTKVILLPKKTTAKGKKTRGAKRVRKSRLRFIIPKPHHNYDGRRAKIINNMERITIYDAKLAEKHKILYTMLMEDTPERMTWWVIRDSKEQETTAAAQPKQE